MSRPGQQCVFVVRPPLTSKQHNRQNNTRDPQSNQLCSSLDPRCCPYIFNNRPFLETTLVDVRLDQPLRFLEIKIVEAVEAHCRHEDVISSRPASLMLLETYKFYRVDDRS